eukprot:10790881-Alexandrium_andersonii.AAC.1
MAPLRDKRRPDGLLFTLPVAPLSLCLSPTGCCHRSHSPPASCRLPVPDWCLRVACSGPTAVPLCCAQRA